MLTKTISLPDSLPFKSRVQRYSLLLNYLSMLLRFYDFIIKRISLNKSLDFTDQIILRMFKNEAEYYTTKLADILDLFNPISINDVIERTKILNHVSYSKAIQDSLACNDIIIFKPILDDLIAEKNKLNDLSEQTIIDYKRAKLLSECLIRLILLSPLLIYSMKLGIILNKYESLYYLTLIVQIIFFILVAYNIFKSYIIVFEKYPYKKWLRKLFHLEFL